VYKFDLFVKSYTHPKRLPVIFERLEGAAPKGSWEGEQSAAEEPKAYLELIP
jgi:hypothetical protein